MCPSTLVLGFLDQEREGVYAHITPNAIELPSALFSVLAEEEQAAAPPKSPSPAERTSLDKAMSCWAEASTVLVPPPVDLYENQSVEHSEGEMSGEWELVDHE